VLCTSSGEALSYPITFANVMVLMLIMQLVGARKESGILCRLTHPVQWPPKPMMMVTKIPMVTFRPPRRFPRVFTHGENACFMWTALILYVACCLHGVYTVVTHQYYAPIRPRSSPEYLRAHARHTSAGASVWSSVL